MITCLVRTILCLAIPLLGNAAPTDGQISLAIDERKGLNPVFTSPLFTLNTFSSPEQTVAANTNADLVIFANWTNTKLHYAAANLPLPTYLQNNDKAVELFESKSNWKVWMHSIGLGNYVPHTYSYNFTSGDTSTLEFPAVLKLNHHFGRGVFVMHDAQQLNKLVQAVTKRGFTYTIEEALTGMGLAEVTSFGSVYQGKLLALRCIKLHFPAKNAARTAHYWYGGNSSTAPTTDTFVRGFMLNNKHDIYVPCSQELINVNTTMFAQAPPYTGLFCSDIKSDKHDRVKMMEINARFCGSMAKNHAIFTAAYVPLSYAVLAGAGAGGSATVGWPNKPIYTHINNIEAQTLSSGGGIQNGEHIFVDRFNHTLVIDKPSYR